jgi:hypothetical protein
MGGFRTLSITVRQENSATAAWVGYSHPREDCGMPDQPVERKLTAILAADDAGCSPLMRADEVGTLRQLSSSGRSWMG